MDIYSYVTYSTDDARFGRFFDNCLFASRGAEPTSEILELLRGMWNSNCLGEDQTLAFLGITLDVSQSLSVLPEDKLLKCRSLLQEALACKTMTLRELQSLLGHLNFACRVVVPGRC